MRLKTVFGLACGRYLLCRHKRKRGCNEDLQAHNFILAIPPEFGAARLLLVDQMVVTVSGILGQTSRPQKLEFRLF
jgi:hypothetical protein